ncbi:MAG: putative rane protein [Clostridiales bacterium]|jgi:sodium transport system permease protein|nr:putative rane protein [Clostridiales bacterium]
MIFTLIKKELLRVFTDKKLIFSIFILPPLMMFIIYGFMGFMISKQVDDVKSHVSTIIVKNAPEEFKQLIPKNLDTAVFTFVDSNVTIEDYKDQILNKELDLFVEFEDNFVDKVINYQTNSIPQVKTYYNDTEDYSNSARSIFIDGFLTPFEDMFIKARFSSMDDLIAFNIDADNPESIIHNEKKAGGQFLGMLLPMIIIVFLFSAIMGITVDAVAGEKERGTMATLLLAPVSRINLALGKIFGLLIVSVLSALAMLAGCISAFPIFMKSVSSAAGEESADLSGLVNIQLQVTDWLMLLVLLISMAILFVSIVCLLSVISKNIKEASTLITPMYLLIMVAAYANMFGSGEPSAVSYLIPVYNQGLSIKLIFEGSLTPTNFLITVGITVAIALVLIATIAKCFKNEKIMLNS